MASRGRTLDYDVARKATSAECPYVAPVKYTALSCDAASVFARRHRHVEFPGVKAVSVRVASALAAQRGTLILSGIETLTAPVARALAEHQGTLGLPKVAQASAEVLEALACHSGPVLLPSLRLTHGQERAQRVTLARNSHLQFDDRAIDVCATLDGCSLPWLLEPDLSGEAITRAIAARMICKASTFAVDACGYEKIDDDAAKVLATVENNLLLDDLRCLSDLAAAALAGHKGTLCLRGLESLSDAAVMALLAHPSVVWPQRVGVVSAIRALWDEANRSAATEVLSVLWEKDGRPDWLRRSEVCQRDYPEIPGGFTGSRKMPCCARWRCDLHEDAVRLRIEVVDPLEEFPVEELEVAAQTVVDRCSQGPRVTVAVIGDDPSESSDDEDCISCECQWFWDWDEESREWR